MLAVGNLNDVDYDEAPTVLILGDDRSSATADAARAVGTRVVDCVSLDMAEARLDQQVDVDTVILILRNDEGALADRLLDRIDLAAREGRYRGVVIVPASLIDVAAARLNHGDVTLLADPEPIESAAAIAIACARNSGRQRLHDRGNDGGTLRLVELTQEVGRLAKQLAALTTHQDNPPAQEATTTLDVAAGEDVDATTIRAFIRARRVRDQFFRGDFFADPAWDILLDLAAARKEGRGVSVSSLCIAAAVPPTTALRWIKSLGDEGLLVRRADPTDGRRVFIALTERAAAGVDACLATIIRTLKTI
ncbi:winged helix DNA-binding protein [Sphingomonas quercus]|uniref:Winged helix DNA-binding protein n=1 Tax=Sphingomonas quercus TaxID=2842451 RepID=A0ABS6BL02_9SPHN|nr:winged helix DNA-binding protein [Sphingomonas quercus]MBU3078974.1 winged helix DNA-binding protein [Sphingomonas quercus]